MKKVIYLHIDLFFKLWYNIYIRVGKRDKKVNYENDFHEKSNSFTY